ncbi:ROK family transcriptional regulator [Maritalea mediterranea]|uniref:ROK family transcriptional regulator n=1 Tax=Maritalea mediterranea TaxID=2909667 RepID=A0ABS9E8Z5_9HYPH|nr:ROK family transcriptional regulator [Maritalea mediterranea]MCF4099355.1 ROK family transcriptional regulator [Maritalea mediterranea]
MLFAENEKTNANRFSQGTNQSEMRANNERLVLTLLRYEQGLAKADIARKTGLSAQTVARLISKLSGEGLIEKGKPQKGRIGQPSTPLSLAASGAYFWGLKVGRRSVELALVDFLGNTVRHEKKIYDYPEFDVVIDFACAAVEKILETEGPETKAHLKGMGLAMPGFLWSWAPKIGVSPDRMVKWKTADLRKDLAERLGIPVFSQNDATAACSAEMVFGKRFVAQNALYFYVGFFIGGGLVLNGSLFTGSFGNAAGLGPLLVPTDDGNLKDLLDVASLAALEKQLDVKGFEGRVIWEDAGVWTIDAEILTAWLEQAANGIAHAIHTAQAIIDAESVIIDGWLPTNVRHQLIEKTKDLLHKKDFTGVSIPEVQEGSVGTAARTLGAASLPLKDRFLIE